MDDPSPKLQLDYYNSSANRMVFPPAWDELPYRLALGCWFVPLVLGVCNFLCWYVLRSNALKILGVGIVIFGFVAAAASLICGGYFLVARLRAGARIWRQAFLPLVVLFALLVLSLLLTIVCCGVAYG